MTHTTKRQPKASTKHHPEYETIGREVDLGIAILIAETEDCGCEPMDVEIYKVWSRDYEGQYAIVYEMDAASMKPTQPAQRRQ